MADLDLAELEEVPAEVLVEVAEVSGGSTSRSTVEVPAEELVPRK